MHSSSKICQLLHKSPYRRVPPASTLASNVFVRSRRALRAATFSRRIAPPLRTVYGIKKPRGAPASRCTTSAPAELSLAAYDARSNFDSNSGQESSKPYLRYYLNKWRNLADRTQAVHTRSRAARLLRVASLH